MSFSMSEISSFKPLGKETESEGEATLMFG